MPDNICTSSGSSKTNTPRRNTSDSIRDDRAGKSDFLCRVKYSNTLPDIPFDSKFLACPFVSLSRFTDYKPSSLEKNFKFELLCEPDCGVDIDLINPETYYFDAELGKKQHHPADLELLEDEQANSQNLRRSQQHSKIVPWMRKTEYISSEFTRFGVSADRQETKIGYSTRKKHQSSVIYRDRTSQIAAIDQTFELASKPVINHPTKKGVTAVEVMPLLPDYENWMHPFALVIFDGDPMPQFGKENSQTLMSQALIRGMMNEEGEQFVTYFLPSKETLEKRMIDVEKSTEFDSNYVYEYISVRDYNWIVRNKSVGNYEEDNFLFSFRDDSVYYNELETKVYLNRRKAKRSRQDTKLMVRNRAYDDNELSNQQDRLNSLLHPYDEKDEEGSDKEESVDENETNAVELSIEEEGEKEFDEDFDDLGEIKDDKMGEEEERAEEALTSDDEKRDENDAMHESNRDQLTNNVLRTYSSDDG